MGKPRCFDNINSVLHGDGELLLGGDFLPNRLLRLVAEHRRQLCKLAFHRVHKLRHALAGGGGNEIGFKALLLGEVVKLVYHFLNGGVRLVQSDYLRAGAKLRREFLQLRIDFFVVLYGVAILQSRNVDNMKYQAAAFHMAKKIVTESDSLRGALNKAGDVRHNKGAALVHAHNAEHRSQGGERIVRNFGLCGGNHGNKRGFAHVREAHKTHICQKLQFKGQLKLLAGVAGLGEAGNLPCGGCKMAVTPAALASASHNMRLLVGNVRNNAPGFRVLHKSAHRHFYDKIRCGFARAALGKAGLAVLRDIVFLIFKVDKAGNIGIPHKYDIAAATAVAAVGAAGVDELLLMEAHGAVAAFSRSYPYFRCINEHYIPPKAVPTGTAQKALKKGRIFTLRPRFNKQLLLDRIYADFLLVCTKALESYDAVGECEESIVRAFADILTGMNVSSALSYKNVSCKNELAVRSFCAKALRFGIAAVFSGAHTFFMGEELHTKSKHDIIPP